jgi:hypothetical protein
MSISRRTGAEIPAAKLLSKDEARRIAASNRVISANIPIWM